LEKGIFQVKKNPVLIVLVTAIALGALFFGIVFLVSLLSGNKRSSTTLQVVGADRIALVRLEGLLVSSEHIVEELNDYAEDSSIKAIVIRIDSPGGGVVASQEIYNAIKSARHEGKKVVASMGTVAASGGYYVAAAADRIVANPGTLTGSIGVKMEFASIEKLLEKIGVKGMVVKAGEYKDVGSPFRDMTEPEKKILQDVIDDVHSQFIKAVAEGRNLQEAEVRSIADGRIFTGRQALDLKLVDQLGDLTDSIKVAGELVGIKGKPRVIEKRKTIPFFDYLKEESAAWIADVVTRGIGRSSVSLQYL
jgi:protease-4